jgi:two-component system osmolarity sensor histidine kinase EnvZ
MPMIDIYLKKMLPRTLSGRAAAILLLPMLTLQLTVAVVFVQRHFQDVTVQMTTNLLLEISMVLDELDDSPIETVATTTAASLNIDLQTWNGSESAGDLVFYDISGRTIIPLLYRNLPGVIDVDLSNLSTVIVILKSAVGPVKIEFPRNRVSASNPHQLLVLMVFTGIFMTLIAFFFLRNQLRPIKRLSAASAAFGKGISLPFHPSGAIEVRAAGQAFLDMRQRIESQIEQRTVMLSGISHDLRTPITRLQLGLELLDTPDAEDLKADLDTMRLMVDSFLTYARDTTGEPITDVDLVNLLAKLLTRFEPTIKLIILGTPRKVSLKETSIVRALENLIMNATRYGDKIELVAEFNNSEIRIGVHDNGTGIPTDKREQAVLPFVRLEPARNQNNGSGVGLGLAIAADVARSHGGQLILSDSKKLGGLSAQIVLPT